MKNNRKLIISLCILFVVIIGVMFSLFNHFKQPTQSGEKEITVVVIDADGKEDTFKYHTDREYLGEVLKDENLIEGEEGTYGIFIQSVNGIKADDSKQQWWCITKDKQQVNTSADQTPISDKDQYELTLTEGY